MTINLNRSYPRTIACDGGDVELRLLTPDDGAAVLAFAQTLSAHDLLFLRRDISQPRVVAAWMEATRNDAIVSVIATRPGEVNPAPETPAASAPQGGAHALGRPGDVLGCATIVRDDLSWSRHVGELRVLVAPAVRGIGLGQKLTQECFAVALEMGLEKLMAQMTVDQRGAIGVFEGLGFRAEALLHDHVKDRDGRTHDIVILSHDVAKFQSQMAAYGLTEALQ